MYYIFYIKLNNNYYNHVFTFSLRLKTQLHLQLDSILLLTCCEIFVSEYNKK